MSLDNSSVELIIGTNEEFLLGFYIFPKKDGTLEFQSSFSNHSHIGRVKQVAINDQFLLSGSTDEHLRIFNLHSRKELGYLLPHEGTITCLEYHESGFFFSAAEDGKIVIFKQGKWEIEKELIGHNSPIVAMAIHPSGRIAISISKNKRMITWDLIKGKRAYMSGLQKGGDIIKWTPSGQQYLISSGPELNIYDVETGNISQSVIFVENINCILFINDDLIAVGGEGKHIYLYNLLKRTIDLSWEAHTNRVKSLVAVDYAKEDLKYIASASSDGYIKIWEINIGIGSTEPTKSLAAEVNTKSRIICMAVRSLNSGLFPATNEFDRYEQAFQQNQDDYQTLQKKRRLENYNSKQEKYELKTAQKARVVVVEEISSKIPKKKQENKGTNKQLLTKWRKVIKPDQGKVSFEKSIKSSNKEMSANVKTIKKKKDAKNTSKGLDNKLSLKEKENKSVAKVSCPLINKQKKKIGKIKSPKTSTILLKKKTKVNKKFFKKDDK